MKFELQRQEVYLGAGLTRLAWGLFQDGKLQDVFLNEADARQAQQSRTRDEEVLATHE